MFLQQILSVRKDQQEQLAAHQPLQAVKVQKAQAVTDLAEQIEVTTVGVSYMLC